MFFPLKDDNPTFHTPYLTIGLIAINILVFLYEVAAPVGMQTIIAQYGLIPSALLGGTHPYPQVNPAGPIATLFTSMFLHGGWMHLIGNMLFLWIFGNNIEDALGSVRFIIFYLACGLGAAFLQIIVSPDSTIPMVGASGAISGVLGAYIILYPRVKIFTLVFLGIFITTARITAAWFLGIWIGYQGIFALLESGNTGGGTAWFAHIGGFIAGATLIFVMKPGRRPTLNFGAVRRPRQSYRPPEDDNVHRGPWG